MNSLVHANTGQTARDGRPVPDFVPKWMMRPDSIFNPARALCGAVRMGDVKLAEEMITFYGLGVDREKTLRQADLNWQLMLAINKICWQGGTDVEAVRQLIKEGADPNAAIWAHVDKKWIWCGWDAQLFVRPAMYGADHSPELNARAAEVLRILGEAGGSDEPKMVVTYMEGYGIPLLPHERRALETGEVAVCHSDGKS